MSASYRPRLHPTIEEIGEPAELRRSGPIPAAAARRPRDAAQGPAFNRTDAGNGEHFARLFGNRIRFDHRRGRWLIWQDNWWRDDDTRAVRRLAKEAARTRYGGAISITDLRDREAEARFAIASENRQRIDAMLAASQSEPPIADAGDRWDADPWLLGVANGILDLRTGALRPGSPADRITRHTEVPYERDARCPRWLRFLEEVFAGDDELTAFIARAVGYSLTGDTSEQCLFTCYGTGSNGKTVLLTIIRSIAGMYAVNTPFSTFEARSRTSIPNDVAALAGARLVTASETSEDTRLNESRLKALTGGDEISARFLNHEFFTFRPVAKFWLAVNHKPRVADDSFGFWRRVRLIPFTRQFNADADPRLVEALAAELPGILGWAVAGAHAWQDRGLDAHAAVTSATATYRAESDPLADFIVAACVVADSLVVGASAAYRAYRSWATELGLGEREMLTSTKFGTRMKSRFASDHKNTGNVYLGVGIRAERSGHAIDVSVKGPVKGSKIDFNGPPGPSSGARLTRENPERGFTTLHPSSVGPMAVEEEFGPGAWDIEASSEAPGS